MRIPIFGNVIDLRSRRLAGWVVLCDSTLVLDYGDRTTAVTDDRFRQVIARTRREAVAGSETVTTARPVTLEKWRYTNQPGGYWIAAADPQAAYRAMTGNAPLTGPSRVHRAALLTDGASAAVDRFHLFEWTGQLDTLSTGGPSRLIRQIRSAEAAADLDDTRRDTGKWEIPGGILELDESLHPGMSRKVEEEAGLIVESDQLTGV
jgi:hypothetical protein